MDPDVFFAVLASAALHALLHSSLKIKADPAVATTMLAIGSGIIATLVLPFTGLPEPAAYPFLALSVVIHVFYWSFLGKAYASWDLGQVYPIARGCAPLLTAAGALVLTRDQPQPEAWLGFAVIVAGILLIALRGGRVAALFNAQATGFVAVTTLSIAGYTLVDGLGARHAGSAFAYVTFLYICNGWTLLAYGLARQRRQLVAAVDASWHFGLVTGALSLFVYDVGMWAMTKAPIATVAALRETSILFAVLFATIVLKEPFRPPRIVGACIVCLGLVIIRLI